MKTINGNFRYFHSLSFFIIRVSKGFTLIELIIVMAILGILAAGLLAALNPVEQVNRATDTKNINGVKSVADAINRYFATTTAVPWGTIATLPLGTAVVPTLAAGNELKTGFTLPTAVTSGNGTTVGTWASTTTPAGSYICTTITSSGVKYRGNATSGAGAGYGCTYPTSTTCTYFCGSL